jgi:hypothetical protein
VHSQCTWGAIENPVDPTSAIVFALDLRPACTTTRRVGVGRDSVAVVDLDEVPVAVLPAGLRDRAAA